MRSSEEVGARALLSFQQETRQSLLLDLGPAIFRPIAGDCHPFL